MSDPVGNLEDRFSHNEAHIPLVVLANNADLNALNGDMLIQYNHIAFNMYRLLEKDVVLIGNFGRVVLKQCGCVCK